MADRNRGGRARDDDEEPFEVDDELEELDDEFDEDEDAFDEEDEDADEAPASRRNRTAGAGARTRTVTRARTKEATAPGFFGRIVNFIREIFAELQKVIWPTRKELLTYTTVVIVFVAIMMTFVALLDVGFARLMFLVFGNKSTPAAS